MRILFFFLLALSQIATAQEKLTPFSELSGIPDAYFQSVQISDGYLYVVPTYNPTYQLRFFKLNEEGKIVDSLVINNDSTLYTGHLYRQNGVNYFVAMSYPMPFDNFFISSSNTQREVFKISDDLKIVSHKKIGKLPNQYASNAATTTLGVSVFQSEGVFVQKDTLFLMQSYFIMDSIGVWPKSRGVRYEQIGIGTNSFWNQKEMPILQGNFYGSFITDKYLYSFGELDTKMFPSGIPYNAGLMGKFDKTGKLLLPAEIDKEGSGVLGDGLMGTLHNNNIYCAYSGRFKNEVCEERIATIDRRDLNFNMIKRATVSHCNAKPSGNNPFAFAPNGDIYFQCALGAQVGIYKYNSNLDLLWGKLYDLPYHAPLSIKITKDNGILVECSELVPATGKTYVKLYKLNADGNVTSTINLGNITSSKNLFYPNPFQSQLTLHEAIEGASEVQLYDMSGRVIGIFSIHNTTIEINEQLPKGVYIAQLKDIKGSILGMQTIVKQ
jgi:hypothetical protein